MSLYLERYAWPHNLFPDYQPDPDLEMVVVIPCFNEPNIEKALESLNNCHAPSKALILVIVNESESEISAVTKQNSDTVKTLSHFASSHELKYARVKLPKKKAGVGLARKIGMDEAVRMFEFLGKDGIIVCYDADCTCEPNYLQSIYDFFKNYENECGIVFYEHGLKEYTETIVDYELHLRYYIDALRWAGIPHAYQTLGSCITVKSKRYQKEGGMNSRKAGEDFYFLHKLIPNGKFGEINTTTVYPSSRISDRVPFGTGHAVAKNLKKNFQTYNPLIFEEIKSLSKLTGNLYLNESVEFPEGLAQYLEKIDWNSNVTRIRKESSGLENFRVRFFKWLDGFKILKCVHFLRNQYYPNVSISKATDWLAERQLFTKHQDTHQALTQLRKFDRLNR